MKTQTSKSQIYCPMAAIRYARVDYHVPFGVPEEYETAQNCCQFEELI